MRWMGALAIASVWLTVSVCGSDISRLSVEDQTGDASPPYLDIVEASTEFTAGDVIVKIDVAAPFPARVRTAASWTTNILAPEKRQFIITAHLEGRKWSAEVGRSTGATEPPARANPIKVTAPTDRTLTLVVPGELVGIDDLNGAAIEFSSSGAKGVVDSATAR